MNSLRLSYKEREYWFYRKAGQSGWWFNASHDRFAAEQLDNRILFNPSCFQKGLVL